MPRDISPVIESILASDSHNVWLAVDITLPSPYGTVRAAEIEMDVTSLNLLGASVDVDPVTYPALLKQEPQIKFSKGKAPSGGTLVVYDLDNVLGASAGQLETILEDAKIVLSTCWEKSNGTFEADIYFIGQVRDVRADDTECTFNVIADTDSRMAFVAGRSLTQRCLANFGDDRCQRPAELIAPGETCSNIFDDGVNGCLSKRWQWAYWGVPFFSSIENFSSGGGGVTGWDGNGGGDIGGDPGCPKTDNYALIIDSSGNKIPLLVAKLKQGMIVVDALNRRAVIDEIDFFTEDKLFRATLDNGAVTECTMSEPLISDIYDAQGTPASRLRERDQLLCFDVITDRHITSRIKKIEIEKGSFSFARITLSNKTASLYLSGQDTSLMVVRHNASAKDSWLPGGGY